jgi:hypothetical protein
MKPHPVPPRSLRLDASYRSARSSTLLLMLLVLTTGCATLGSRTEGQSGPLAWRTTDLAIVAKNVGGQAAETYDFTLHIRNVS